MLSTENFQMFLWAEVSLRSLSQLENAEHEKGSLITQRSISIKTVHHFKGLTGKILIETLTLMII